MKKFFYAVFLFLLCMSVGIAAVAQTCPDGTQPTATASGPVCSGVSMTTTAGTTGGSGTEASTQAATQTQVNLLNNLRSLINTFQNQLNQAVTAGTVASPSPAGQATGGGTCNFAADLRLGDTGAAVTRLTELLARKGFIESGQSIFDTEVREAVVAYQEEKSAFILAPAGLTLGTGFVGPSTRAYINTHENCGTSTGSSTATGSGTGTGGVGTGATSCQLSSDLRLGSTGTPVSSLTRVLVAAGLLSQQSSTFDMSVYTAVVAYQERFAAQILTPNGLTKGTGFVGPSTRTHMNSSVTCGGTGSTSGTGAGTGGTTAPTGQPSNSPRVAGPAIPASSCTGTELRVSCLNWNSNVPAYFCEGSGDVVMTCSSLGTGNNNIIETVRKIPGYGYAGFTGDITAYVRQSQGGQFVAPFIQPEIDYTQQKMAWFTQVYGSPVYAQYESGYTNSAYNPGGTHVLLEGSSAPLGTSARNPIAMYNYITRQFRWMPNFSPAELYARGLLSPQWSLYSLFVQTRNSPPSTINPTSQVAIMIGLGEDAPAPNTARVSSIGPTYRFNGTVWVKQ